MRKVICLTFLSLIIYNFAAAENVYPKIKIEVPYTLQAGFPELNESKILKSVGIPVVKKYKLDDGYGLAFRKSDQPDFAIEFRENRVNVSWWQFKDEPKKFKKINEENEQLAQNVLTVALGSDLTNRIMEYTKQQQPVIFNSVQGPINVSVSESSALVTIYKNPK